MGGKGYYQCPHEKDINPQTGEPYVACPMCRAAAAEKQRIRYAMRGARKSKIRCSCCGGLPTRRDMDHFPLPGVGLYTPHLGGQWCSDCMDRYWDERDYDSACAIQALTSDGLGAYVESHSVNKIEIEFTAAERARIDAELLRLETKYGSSGQSMHGRSIIDEHLCNMEEAP